MLMALAAGAAPAVPPAALLATIAVTWLLGIDCRRAGAGAAAGALDGAGGAADADAEGTEAEGAVTARSVTDDGA
jgi:hypothetical protein